MNEASDSDSWRVTYPHPADFNFDYARLLNTTRTSGLARNTQAGLRVAIVGAGVAGLAAAHELFRCGVTHIDIYEASDRIGGRLKSQRVAGQHTVFELGAMRLPMFSHEDGPSCICGHYTEALGISMQPFPGSARDDVSFGLYSSQDNAFRLKPRLGSLPVAPAVDAVRHKWEVFAGRLAMQIRAHYGTPRWPVFWRAFEQRYWRHSFREVMLMPATAQMNMLHPGDLGGVGLDEAQLVLVDRFGVGQGSWSAYLDVSAMLAFRLLFFAFFDDLHLIQGRFDGDGDYRGGPHAGDTTLTDSLDQAIAAPQYLGMQSIVEGLFFTPVRSDHVAPVSLYDALRDRRYDVGLFTRTAVGTIERRADGRLAVHFSAHTRDYDAVLLTAPMSGKRTAMRMSGFTQAMLPAAVSAGDRMSHWLSSSKVFVALKERFWEKSPIPQVIASDTWLDQTYGYAVRTPRIADPGVLLLSYTWETSANVLLGEDDDGQLVSRAITTLDDMLKEGGVAGRISDYVDESQSAVVHWYRDPTIRGAGRLYRPGIGEVNQALSSYNQECSGLSGVYLAGEAYSLAGTWVESALRQSSDAVLHLLHNHHAVFAAGFDFAHSYPRHSTKWAG